MEHPRFAFEKGSTGLGSAALSPAYCPGLTKLRYLPLFFAGLWHKPTPKSCQTGVGRGGESRIDWYDSGPYFSVQEIDLHLSFQAQQNGVLLLGAMEALQLRTRCKLTVPGSWFLFISTESHGRICKQFPVTNAKGKKRPLSLSFPCTGLDVSFGVTSDPGQSFGTEEMESNHSLCYSYAKTPMYCTNYSDLLQVITDKIYRKCPRIAATLTSNYLSWKTD